MLAILKYKWSKEAGTQEPGNKVKFSYVTLYLIIIPDAGSLVGAGR